MAEPSGPSGPSTSVPTASQPGPVSLELRVHGVRGTAPGSMLGVDAGDVHQVAGDDRTGFYRPEPDATIPMRTLPPGMALEAYSWGALTSGVRGLFGWVNRVLWLALLPFALVNMAFWARLKVGQPVPQARWGLRAVRVAGLLLTVTAVLTPCLVAVDLIAWQCFRGNTVACPVMPDWTDQLASLSTGQRLAVASLAPLAAVAAMVLVSFRTLARYEATTWGVDAPGTMSDVGILGHRRMWDGEDRTRRLQRIHIAAALATIAAFSGIHLLVVVDRYRLWPTTVAAGVILVAAVALVTVVDPKDLEAETERRWSGRWTRHTHDALAWTALVVLVAHLAVLCTIRVPLAHHDRNFAGSNVWFIALFLALVVLHVIMFVGGRLKGPAATAMVALLLATIAAGVVYALSDDDGLWVPSVLAAVAALIWLGLLLLQRSIARRRHDEFGQTAWAGAGSSVLLGAATMVALLYTTALVVASANYLNGEQQSVDDLITARHEVSPMNVTAGGRPTLLAGGEVKLDGARVTAANGSMVVSSGRIDVESLSASDDRLATVGLASTRVRRALLLLPEDTTTVAVESTCFGRLGDPDYKPRRACTGESAGFRTAGTIAVPASCQRAGTAVPCLQIEATGGRISIDVADPPQTPIVVPQVLVWTPLMQFLLIVLGAVVVALAVLRYSRGAAPALRQAALDDDAVAQPDQPSVARARVSAGFAHRAERLLDPLGALTSLLALVMLALSVSGRPPWDVFEAFRPWATVSLYTVVLASLALMAAGAQIRKSPEARRSFGIIWDITTFWPRAAHPFGPPCYAERVVPEITARVRWALGRAPDQAVVLSGHSQGSLICAAVLCRLRGEEHRIRVITYGSQIRAIYGRVFPAAAGPEAFGYERTPGPTHLGRPEPDLPTTIAAPPPPGTGLRGTLSSPGDWVNLFRRGDPLGYRVFSDQDGGGDRPTLEVPTANWGDPGPRVMTHGGYPHTPEYREAIAAWTGEAVQPPPTTVADVPPLPPP